MVKTSINSTPPWMEKGRWYKCIITNTRTSPNIVSQDGIFVIRDTNPLWIGFTGDFIPCSAIITDIVTTTPTGSSSVTNICSIAQPLNAETENPLQIRITGYFTKCTLYVFGYFTEDEKES